MATESVASPQVDAVPDGGAALDALAAALASMDPVAFSALLAEDVVIEHVPIDRVLRGRQEATEWFAAVMAETTQNEVVIRRWCQDGNTIFAERADRHLVAGVWVEIPIMGIIELDQAGRMTLMRDYFDSRLAL